MRFFTQLSHAPNLVWPSKACYLREVSCSSVREPGAACFRSLPLLLPLQLLLLLQLLCPLVKALRLLMRKPLAQLRAQHQPPAQLRRAVQALTQLRAIIEPLPELCYAMAEPLIRFLSLLRWRNQLLD